MRGRFFTATPAPAPLLEGVDHDAGPVWHAPRGGRLDGLFAKIESTPGTDLPETAKLLRLCGWKQSDGVQSFTYMPADL